jgi:hypothetical protein
MHSRIPFVILFLMLGCGNNNISKSPTKSWNPPEIRDSVPIAEGPCEQGDSRDCLVEEKTHENTQSCFSGGQLCINGFWSRCVRYNDLPELTVDE